VPDKPIPSVYTVCQLSAWFAFRLCLGFRAYGQKNVPLTGGALLLSNHQSYLDPVVIGAPLRRRLRFMARETLFRNPLFGTLLESVGAFPVRRGRPDKTSIRHAIELLASGEALVMFPEGTRSHDGRLQPILGGFTLLVRKANAPVVPIAVDGTHRAWPRSKRLPTPARVRVAYGVPIPPDEFNGITDAQAGQRVWNEIAALLDALRRLP